MVRHIVSWNLNPNFTEEEKAAARVALAEGSAKVKAEVPGSIVFEFDVNPLPTSNCDVSLYSEFETEEILAAYQIHPIHVAFGSVIKANCCDRRCADVNF